MVMSLMGSVSAERTVKIGTTTARRRVMISVHVLMDNVSATMKQDSTPMATGETAAQTRLVPVTYRHAQVTVSVPVGYAPVLTKVGLATTVIYQIVRDIP